MAISCLLRFYLPRSATNDLRWRYLAFYVFTCRSAFPMPFGDSIFRCTAKDRGERRAKGIAIPLNPRGVMFWWKPDVLCANHLAKVRLTRLSRLRCREANTLGVRSAYPLASACCTTTKDRHISKTTRLLTTHHAGYSLSANVFAAVGAVQQSPWKQCEARHGRA